MTNGVLAEIYKLKRAKIKWITIVLFIPSIIVFLMYGFNDKYPLVEWESYLNAICTFLNDLVAPIVYGIIGAYIFGHEYETKTMNIMFTYPMNRIKLLFYKMAATFIIICISIMMVFLSSIILGLFIKHDPLTGDLIFYYFISFIKMAFYHFLLANVVCAIAISVKSVLPSIIVVISATFINFVIVNTHLAAFYPWSSPVLLSPHEGVGRTYVPYLSSFIVLIIAFLISLIVAIRKYKHIQ